MPHVKTNGVTLAVQAWPEAPAPPERTAVCIRLVVVPGTNHYTVLLSAHDLVRREVAAFLAA